MPVPSQTPLKFHVGNGVTTLFAFDFKVANAEDLQVKFDGTIKVLGTDYTVTGAGNDNGGTITTTLAPGSGVVISLKRAMPIKRTRDWQELGELPSQTHDNDHDDPILMMQQIGLDAARSIRLRDEDATDSASLLLPLVADRANKYLGFTSGGALAMLAPAAVTVAAGSAVKNVNSVVAAKALTGLADGELVNLTGYYDKYDGGAGPLVYDASSAAAADNVRVFTLDSMPGRLIRPPTTFLDWRQGGVKMDDSTDNRAAIQAIVNSVKTSICPDGVARMSGDIVALNTGNHVVISAGGIVKQMTADKGVFTATQKDNVIVENHGLITHALGAWSALWVGNSGHLERGIRLLGCTRSHVFGGGTIRNFGHAGIEVNGGSGCSVRQRIEGTHAYSTVIPALSNFQIGLFLTDDVTYGAPTGFVADIDISGTAQGLLRERNLFATDNAGSYTIRGVIHDIPGQHACYFSDGGGDVDIVVKSITLSAIKMSSPLAGQVVRRMRCRVHGDTIGSHVFEFETLSTGSVQDVEASCVATTVSGAAASILNKMSNIKFDLIVNNATYGFQAQGANQTDIEFRLNGKTFQREAVLITSLTSAFKGWVTAREPNTSNTANTYGILLNSVSTTLDLYDPDVTDANTRMVYGLFNQTDGGIVRVHGSAVFTGASDTAVRATGRITEWPTNTTLSGTNGDFTTLAHVRSSQPIKTKAQSTSAANVILWELKLDDEAVYRIEIDLVGRLDNTNEQLTTKLIGSFFRNGGGVATLIDAVTEVEKKDSAGFAGAYSLAVNGADGISLQVNSGGVATCKWAAVSKSFQSMP